MPYFVKLRGAVEGPFTEAELERRTQLNEISRVALVSSDGKIWTALAKTEIYKRIAEGAMQKATPPRPDPAKTAPSAVPVPEPASAAAEEDEAPVMARHFASSPPIPSYGPSFEELRRGYSPAHPMAESATQPFNNYGRGNPAHRYDLYENSDVSERSRVTYQWLGFFFGRLGVHNFYAGRTGAGLTQLGLTGMLLGVRFLPYFGLIAFPVPEVMLVAWCLDLILTFWVWVDIFSVDRDCDNRIMQGQSIAGMLLLFTVVLIVLLGVLVALLMNAAVNATGS